MSSGAQQHQRKDWRMLHLHFYLLQSEAFGISFPLSPQRWTNIAAVLLICPAHQAQGEEDSRQGDKKLRD